MTARVSANDLRFEWTSTGALLGSVLRVEPFGQVAHELDPVDIARMPAVANDDEVGGWVDVNELAVRTDREVGPTVLIDSPQVLVFGRGLLSCPDGWLHLGRSRGRRATTTWMTVHWCRRSGAMRSHERTERCVPSRMSMKRSTSSTMHPSCCPPIGRWTVGWQRGRQCVSLDGVNWRPCRGRATRQHAASLPSSPRQRAARAPSTSLSCPRSHARRRSVAGHRAVASMVSTSTATFGSSSARS